MSRIVFSDAHPNDLVDVAYYGRGSRAELFTAIRRDSRERVLLKVVTTDGPLGDLLADGVRQEAALISALAHPSIVHCWGSRECLMDKHSATTLVLKWLPRTLASEVERNPEGLGVDVVGQLLRDGLSAIAYLHGQRIAIRFQSLDSWSLDPRSGFILSELCAARTNDSDPDVPEIARYLAPELLTGEIRGRHGTPPPEAYFLCDLYSLGFIAYEACVGTTRLSGLETLRAIWSPTGPDDAKLSASARWEKWHRNTKEHLPPVRQIRPEVPEWLAKTLDSLVVKDSTRRPHDARVLLDYLPAS